MECAHCNKEPNNHNTAYGPFRAYKLPTGRVLWACRPCGDKIVLDWFIKQDEFNKFDGDRELIAR